MKKIICLSVLLLVGAVLLHAVPTQSLPKSEVVTIDRVELKLTVKSSAYTEVRILQITSESRFFIEGKYATTEQLAIGDTVWGTIHRRADGVYEVVRLNIKKAPALAVNGLQPAS